MHETKLCPFSEVRISIPRERLIKLFYSHRILNYKELMEMRGLSAKLEKNIYRLQHAQSIVNIILDRASR